MAISLIGISNNSTSGTSVTVNVPAGAADGDLLLAVFVSRTTAPTQTLPAGFTLLDEEDQTATPGLRASVAYRVRQSGDASSYNFQVSSSTVIAAQIACFRGVDTANLFSVSGSPDYTVAEANSTTITGTGLTTEHDGAWLIFATANASSNAPSTPAGMTLIDLEITSTGSGDIVSGLFYEERATAGATGNRTATLSNSRANVGHMTALRPVPLPLPLGSFGVMPGLQLLIRSAPREAGGVVIADVTPWLTEATISRNRHGDRDCTFACERPLPEALLLYLRRGPLHVEVVLGEQVVWEGRISTPALVAAERAGFRATALGYAAAYRDTRITAVWSDADLANWRPLERTDRPGRLPGRYTIRQGDTLLLELQEGSQYSTGTTLAGFLYVPPDRGARAPTGIEITITHLLPSSTYRVLVRRISGTLAGGTLTTVQTITGTGSAATATHTLNWAPATADYILVEVDYNNAVAVSYTGQTGDHFVEITAARVYTTGAAGDPVEPAQIVRDLVAAVAAKNPAQVDTGTSLVQDTGLDQVAGRWADARPAEILDALAARGDGAGPWVWGVAHGRRLFFHPPGTGGRTWGVVATGLETSQDREALFNAVYATYEDARGRTRRTATAVDADSVARAGLRRETVVQSDGTSSGQAEALRDATLADGADPPPQAGWAFDQLLTPQGVPAPGWLARPGDTIVEQSLPATWDAALDRLRAFRIAETTYDLMTGRLSVVPEAPLPTVDRLLADGGGS